MKPLTAQDVTNLPNLRNRAKTWRPNMLAIGWCTAIAMACLLVWALAVIDRQDAELRAQEVCGRG